VDSHRCVDSGVPRLNSGLVVRHREDVQAKRLRMVDDTFETSKFLGSAWFSTPSFATLSIADSMRYSRVHELGVDE
jgi:hypothetical protein